MIENLKLIGGVCGSIITITSLLTLIIKPLRKIFVNWIKKTSKSDTYDKDIEEIKEMLKEHINQDKLKCEQAELLTEASLGLLRDNITKTYYKYLNSDGIPSFEKENIIKQYEIYHKLHGNSFVTVIYNEMLEWKVIK